MAVSMRNRQQIDLDFAASGSANFINWLATQPEGDPGGQVSTKESLGLGDTIAKMTKAVGIKPCGGCKKRQEILNKAVPYRKKA